ncbi:MAG: type II toxin-antitoxin system prevent-host-death family antitoxin [Candidatus Dormibacteraeota bacterium]|nr:type II toxin-antitoxin system prevent-host-death family antitoxin [Candidatus Dormibacteraeota bacterium]
MIVATTAVGVRELKDNLSRYLAVVRDGGELLVTDHGHPVARVVPIQGRTSQERLAELIARGDVTPARRTTRSVPRPVRLRAGAIVSDLIKEQRR